MKTHITICIASYKRPEQLKLLLYSLLRQETYNCFSYSIIIVDNDRNYSAKSVIHYFTKKTNIKIGYYMQPVKNISLTRNMCVRKSDGDFIAFIDDDEYACAEWLYEMYITMIENNVDVVNGQVQADFHYPVSELRKKFFCITYYNTFSTPIIKQGEKGYLVKATNNCLIKSSVIKTYREPFKPEYGLCGGSDTEFFRRISKSGAVFCWAAKAIVYEQIPFKRCILTNILKRIIRNGNINVQINTDNTPGMKRQLIYLFYLFKFFFWACLFPVFLFIGILKINLFIYYFHKLVFYIGVMSCMFYIKVSEYK